MVPIFVWMVILCMKFCTAVVLATEDVVEADETVVVDTEADNNPTASLEVAVALDDDVDPELAPAHQMMPPMMARIMIPEMTYTVVPTDVSPFIVFLEKIKLAKSSRDYIFPLPFSQSFQLPLEVA